MSTALLASKTIIQEEPPQVPNVPGVTTSETGFIGVAERGPVDVATLITGVPDYDRIFGGYVANGELRQAVDAFFLESGGGRVWITRTCHHTDPLDPATATAETATLTLVNADGDDTLEVSGNGPGTFANKIGPRIQAATAPGATARFNFSTMRDTVVVEFWANLSMDPADARYVEKIINNPATGSKFLRVKDLLADADPAVARPKNTTAVANLTGGDDGLTGLADADFIGGQGANGKVGLRCFDRVQRLDVLAAPGRATPAVSNALLAYGEITRNLATFTLHGPPPSLSAEEVATYFGTTAGVLELSEFGAAYWPRCMVLNPNKAIFGAGETVAIDPVGLVAGRMARTAGARAGGIYDPTAGDLGTFRTVLGLESEDAYEEEKRDIVYPLRINPITRTSAGVHFIDGNRTLKSDGNFPGVHERRGAIYIEQSLKDGLQFARHKANTPELRNTMSRVSYTFLELQMSQGAFRSKNPATAFFVDIGDKLNPPSVQFGEQIIARFGIATVKSAEFIILSFSQDTRALDTAVAQAAAA